MDHPHHGVRRREAPDPDDGLRRQLLQPLDVLLLRTLVGEAGCDRVEVPLADHEVPEIGELPDVPEHLLDLGPLEAGLTDELVDADPTRDGGASVDLLECLEKDLPQ